VGSSTNRHSGPASPRNWGLSLAIICRTWASEKLHTMPSLGSASLAGFLSRSGWV
jgi:hypothetical protein